MKNIRIDENYLKGIILQSRGKLKGNYYIITLETCTVVGDDGVIKVTGLTESVAVVAIDKHGNESKLVIV